MLWGERRERIIVAATEPTGCPFAAIGLDNLGITTILVTHDQIEATTMPDRIISCVTAGSSRQARRTISTSGQFSGSSCDERKLGNAGSSGGYQNFS
jgi:hypothetical protein